MVNKVEYFYCFGERWAYIHETLDRYAVSDTGKVMRVSNKRFLKLRFTEWGYPQFAVPVPANGKYKHFKVHRLVAKYFVPNPYGKHYVDHIDTVPDNNDFMNLRWCTAKENSNNPTTKLHQIEKAKGRNLGHVVPTSVRKKISETKKTRIKDGLIKYKRGGDNARAKKISQFTMQGVFMKSFRCIDDAARELNISRQSINGNLRGRNKQAHGYIWKYADE